MSGIIQHLHVESDTLPPLVKALDLALSWHPNKIESWKCEIAWEKWDNQKSANVTVNRPRMLLSSSSTRGSTDWNQFIAPLKAEGLAPLLWAWLVEKLKPEDWGKEPDCDGSVKRGWRLTTSGNWEYDLILEPCWTEYHK